jgi:DNA-binding transcriptional LysR family regulator
MVRVATVNAGTSPVLLPTIAAFRAEHPGTQVEIVGAQEEEIDRGLREGALDLGLITAIAGDDPPVQLQSTTLLAGPPVVCLRPADPLAAGESVSVAQLLAAPLIVMRSGYLMHRYLYRLLGDRSVRPAYSTDGAEMGKLMVAEGLGVTLLPRFSVVGDPLQRGGFITCRPLAEDPEPRIELVLRRREAAGGRSARALHDLFTARAREWARSAAGALGATL